MRNEQGPAGRRREGPSAGPWGDFIEALRFFSRLPTGHRPWGRPDLNTIARVLPFASLVIGLGPVALGLLGVCAGLPPYFAGALAVAAMIVVTGAMADDAIADAADGLFGGASPERRLEIMKDSRHGTYGVVALVLYLGFRIIAFGEIASSRPLTAALLWLGTAILARSASLWLSVALPAARKDGASAAAGGVSRTAFGIGIGLAAGLFALIVIPTLGPPAALLCGLAALIVVLGWQATCRRLVGGQTGDLIGALQALIEIAVLTVLLVFA